MVDFPLTGSGVPVPYIPETFNVTATGSDTLTFGFLDSPSVLALDDVSLNPASPVAEPMSLLLVATGMFGVGSRAIWRAGR